MGRHTIPKTNGKGSIRLVNGNYKVSAVVEGYDPDSIEPKNVTIVEGTNTYTFTIKANGILTIHVTDTGDPQTGVQVIGAKFVRTDSTGNILSEEVITDTDGNAKFSNIPFTSSGSITIYYKQITSDGGHTFDDTVKSIVMNEQNKIVEITNPEAPLRNFTLTDASFPNVVISDGQIILNDN